jgi:hypothetical protein
MTGWDGMGWDWLGGRGGGVDGQVDGRINHYH